MDNETTADRLKRIMSERGLRQVDVLKLAAPCCEKYGVKMNKSDLSQYLSGKSQPMRDKLLVLGEALDVNPDWLMGLDVDMDSRRIIKNIYPIEIKKFPVLTGFADGKPQYEAKSRECYVLDEKVLQADCCMIARDYSLKNSRIWKGDIVFIRLQETVENGDIAAVQVNGAREAILRRYNYYPDNETLILTTDDPRLPLQIYQDENIHDVHVIGKVVAFQGAII